MKTTLSDAMECLASALAEVEDAVSAIRRVLDLDGSEIVSHEAYQQGYEAAQHELAEAVTARHPPVVGGPPIPTWPPDLVLNFVSKATPR